MFKQRNSISVVTATYNAIEDLPVLVDSLKNQTYKDFTWVIADGGSTDGTVEYIKSIEDLHIKLLVRDDFGIYDAINGAIKSSDCEYYVVIGSDDYFDNDAISNFKSSLSDSNPDFVASAWRDPKGIKYPLDDKGWLYGMRGVASCHSVALLIKKELHYKYGFYSNQYPVCADQFFVKTALSHGATIKRQDFVSGFYSGAGFSASSTLLYLTDFFRLQLATEKSKALQLIIFLIRLLKNFHKM